MNSFSRSKIRFTLKEFSLFIGFVFALYFIPSIDRLQDLFASPFANPQSSSGDIGENKICLDALTRIGNRSLRDKSIPFPATFAASYWWVAQKNYIGSGQLQLESDQRSVQRVFAAISSLEPTLQSDSYRDFEGHIDRELASKVRAVVRIVDGKARTFEGAQFIPYEALLSLAADSILAHSILISAENPEFHDQTRPLITEFFEQGSNFKSELLAVARMLEPQILIMPTSDYWDIRSQIDARAFSIFRIPLLSRLVEFKGRRLLPIDIAREYLEAASIYSSQQAEDEWNSAAASGSADTAPRTRPLFARLLEDEKRLQLLSAVKASINRKLATPSERVAGEFMIHDLISFPDTQLRLGAATQSRQGSFDVSQMLATLNDSGKMDRLTERLAQRSFEKSYTNTSLARLLFIPAIKDAKTLIVRGLENHAKMEGRP